MDKADQLKKNLLPAIAFVLPIAFLAGMAGVNEYYLRTSHELILPIEGYDPRDLLSGRFLRYKIKYSVKCPRVHKSRQKAYICFEPEKRITIFSPPENCSLFIKGWCYPNQSYFKAGIDRYYIPEQQAKKLERTFLDALEKNVVLSVTKKGNVLVKDILIDGRPLKSFIQ